MTAGYATWPTTVAAERLHPPPAHLARAILLRALDEDHAFEDLTTRITVSPGQTGRAEIVARAPGVSAGLPAAEVAFKLLDPELRWEARLHDGEPFAAGDVLASVAGDLGAILSAERTALNFLQRLCGIATLTRACVTAVEGIKVRIADTRKTTPGLRVLERYAVRAGGGFNHRDGLRDGVLIKDNHLAAARARGLSLRTVIEQARARAPHTVRIEVECETAAEALEAVDAGAEAVLLDNMPTEEMARVAAAVRGRALLEASGGITLENIRAVAESGVDIISLGALTHSARALDLGLEVRPESGDA